MTTSSSSTARTRPRLVPTEPTSDRRAPSRSPDVHALPSVPLPSPVSLRQEFPLTKDAEARRDRARARLRNRTRGDAEAPVAIVGPCSIHCETAALEYAERLSHLQSQIGDRLQIVMRVYLEKPRTTVGWKGFLYDPDLDGSDDLVGGLRRGRHLMTRIASMGLPIATEILDPLTASYLADCLSWVAIGARTSESQIHRQLASHLPCTVGFKNGTDGGVESAAQACESAARPHTYLGIDHDGQASLLRSPGNESCHLVLRGGRAGPNFDPEAVERAASELRSRGSRGSLLVDCSHGNSQKDYRRQPGVARTVMEQMRAALSSRGSQSGRAADVMGIMLESHLVAGKQTLDVEGQRDQLRYGCSVTDGCIDFATTEGLLWELAELG